jgi:hypothetical protein
MNYNKDGPKVRLNTPGKIIMINESSSISFSCIAEGYPIPNIKWMHNDKVIADEYLSSFNNDNTKEIWVNIKNATRLMNGTYSCNLNDEIEENLELIVTCRFLYVLYILNIINYDFSLI